jgi:3D-(3,5/4)-trihydroxycyclohexane-1,2-dione acylhydrolase (decyclizing)
MSTSGAPERARAIAAAGGVAEALAAGTLPSTCDLSLSEAVVIGLVAQDVRKMFVTLGHGSTAFAEMVRHYAEAGVVNVITARNETEAAHAATALRWIGGTKSAVVTSIGPGALHAFAGSLTSASNGIGVWHIYGDETTEDEGPNFQQLPGRTPGNFQQLCETMGEAYTLHTPEAVSAALQVGASTVDHPYRAGPFFLLLPMNTQPAELHDFRLDRLLIGPPPLLGPASTARIDEALALLSGAKNVVVKIGGGGLNSGKNLDRFLSRFDAEAVLSPGSIGVLPPDHPRNMGVGGSKGSISGNFAMTNAELLVVMGSRGVCQSDSSRTGYPNVKAVININADEAAAMHYGKTVGLVGDLDATLEVLLDRAGPPSSPVTPSEWFEACRAQRGRWDDFVRDRLDHPVIHDEREQRELITQVAAIDEITRWARDLGAVSVFDAGDVQANGFQVASDTGPHQSFTDAGASYMGFSVSALLATAADASMPRIVSLTGDGSLLMTPQALIDGVAQGARGTVVVLDNRRMSAISSLQEDQYGVQFATWDDAVVNFAALDEVIEGLVAIDGSGGVDGLRSALGKAAMHDAVSVIHVPVYFGEDPLGGLGAHGSWNVGPWVPDTQRLRHQSPI